MTNADDALAAAEAAEAEAAEAEAVVAAARARARALRLRREADLAAAATKVVPDATTVDSDAADLDEPNEASEVDSPSETVDDADQESVDVETTESDAVSDADPATAPRRRRLRLSPTVWKVAASAVTVIATVGLLALSITMYINHQRIDKQQRLSAEFAAAARQGVVTLMSLDHTRAQQDVDAIVAVTTGDFKKDFESQSADMVKVAQENKVVTKVTVNAVAVQQTTDDSATVLLAAVSTVSNVASKQQEPRAWRLSVDVARDGDQIKLAKVEFVP